MSWQLGFAEAFLAGKAGQNRRLSRIEGLIDWPAFEVLLPGAAAVGPGRPSYPALAKFKALLLAQWYQLSGPALEEAMAGRISFCRFRLALAHGGHAQQLMCERKAKGIKDRILHRPNKHHRELPRWQARRNALIRPVRSAVERTFGTWKRSYGYTCVRYDSLAANAVELQLKAIAFNLRRAAVLAGT